MSTSGAAARAGRGRLSRQPQPRQERRAPRHGHRATARGRRRPFSPTGRRSSIFFAFGGIVPGATIRISPRSFITSRMASTMLPLTCSALAPGASSTWNSSPS